MSDLEILEILQKEIEDLKSLIKTKNLIIQKTYEEYERVIDELNALRQDKLGRIDIQTDLLPYKSRKIVYDLVNHLINLNNEIL